MEKGRPGVYGRLAGSPRRRHRGGGRWRVGRFGEVLSRGEERVGRRAEGRERGCDGESCERVCRWVCVQRCWRPSRDDGEGLGREGERFGVDGRRVRQRGEHRQEIEGCCELSASHPGVYTIEQGVRARKEGRTHSSWLMSSVWSWRMSWGDSRSESSSFSSTLPLSSVAAALIEAAVRAEKSPRSAQIRLSRSPMLFSGPSLHLSSC